MHSARELRSSMFAIEVAGRAVRLEDLFDGFHEHDRLGLVMSRPHGAVGASALITAAITAFYDIQRARGPDFFIYPDYYLFHVGRPLGDHARLDVFPARKEVVVSDDPQAVLEAIDDRAITRLVVEDRAPAEPALEGEAVASARLRITSCLAYSPSGRVGDADVRIASNPVAEGYVRDLLDPEARLARLRATGGDTELAEAVARRAGEVDPDVRRRIREERAALAEDGVPVETYRRLDLDEALARLPAELPG